MTSITPPDHLLPAGRSSSASTLRFVVLAWFCLAAVIAYIQRTAISLAAPQIQDSLSLTAPMMGFVMSAYYWAYAFSQLPAGILVRRYGTRFMLSFSVGASSVLAGLVALTSTASQFSIVWLLTGIAIAGIFPSCVKSITQWFPANQRAFPSGALASAMSVGGFLSAAFTGWLLMKLAPHTDSAWRLVFVLYAIPGVIWAICFYVWFRDDPPGGQSFDPFASKTMQAVASDSKASNVTDQVRPLGPSGGASQAFSSVQDHQNPTNPYQAPSVPNAEDAVADESVAVLAPLDNPEWLLDYRTWLICGQQFFRAGGYIFYQTWFPTYLKTVHQVSLTSAGLLSSLPLLGVVLGGISGGMFSDWIEQRSGSRRIARQGIGVASHAICGLLIFAAQLVIDPIPAVLLISLGSFVFALGSSASYAINMDLGGSRSATLFALMNMSGNIGAAISPIVVGFLITLLGWSSILPFFGAVYLCAAACWLMLTPPVGKENSAPASNSER